ncbi:syndetin [Anaeramoeba flamelloides]|uniref:Syndetin n=1 Tax=Anaeramoeba flamelloides TaxID=1746091 RepID=A0AAV7YKK6_9EUKA|nr:syndetin [Anaeramoeba flamelloides]
MSREEHNDNKKTIQNKKENSPQKTKPSLEIQSTDPNNNIIKKTDHNNQRQNKNKPKNSKSMNERSVEGSENKLRNIGEKENDHGKKDPKSKRKSSLVIKKMKNLDLDKSPQKMTSNNSDQIKKEKTAQTNNGSSNVLQSKENKQNQLPKMTKNHRNQNSREKIPNDNLNNNKKNNTITVKNKNNNDEHTDDLFSLDLPTLTKYNIRNHLPGLNLNQLTEDKGIQLNGKAIENEKIEEISKNYCNKSTDIKKHIYNKFNYKDHQVNNNQNQNKGINDDDDSGGEDDDNLIMSQVTEELEKIKLLQHFILKKKSKEVVLATENYFEQYNEMKLMKNDLGECILKSQATRKKLISTDQMIFQPSLKIIDNVSKKKNLIIILKMLNQIQNIRLIENDLVLSIKKKEFYKAVDLFNELEKEIHKVKKLKCFQKFHTKIKTYHELISNGLYSKLKQHIINFNSNEFENLIISFKKLKLLNNFLECFNESFYYGLKYKFISIIFQHLAKKIQMEFKKEKEKQNKKNFQFSTLKLDEIRNLFLKVDTSKILSIVFLSFEKIIKRLKTHYSICLWLKEKSKQIGLNSDLYIKLYRNIYKTRTDIVGSIQSFIFAIIFPIAQKAKNSQRQKPVQRQMKIESPVILLNCHQFLKLIYLLIQFINYCEDYSKIDLHTNFSLMLKIYLKKWCKNYSREWTQTLRKLLLNEGWGRIKLKKGINLQILEEYWNSHLKVPSKDNNKIKNSNSSNSNSNSNIMKEKDDDNLFRNQNTYITKNLKILDQTLKKTNFDNIFVNDGRLFIKTLKFNKNSSNFYFDEKKEKISFYECYKKKINPYSNQDFSLFTSEIMMQKKKQPVLSNNENENEKENRNENENENEKENEKEKNKEKEKEKEKENESEKKVNDNYSNQIYLGSIESEGITESESEIERTLNFINNNNSKNPIEKNIVNNTKSSKKKRKKKKREYSILIFTSTSLNLLRIFQEYFKLMKIFPMISASIFDTFLQLYDYYIYIVFKIFKSFQSDSRIFGFKIKNDKYNYVKEIKMPARLKKKINHIANTQKEFLIKSNKITELIQQLDLSNKNNFFGLTPRVIAIESILSINKALLSWKPQIDQLINDPMNPVSINFYEHTLLSSQEITDYVYRLIIRIHLPLGNELDKIKDWIWSENAFYDKNDEYISSINNSVSQFVNKLKIIDPFLLTKNSLKKICIQIVVFIMKILLDGYSYATSCSKKGRDLMKSHFKSIHNDLFKNTRISNHPDFHLVKNFIDAWYLDKKKLLSWCKQNTKKYTKDQLLNLLLSSRIYLNQKNRKQFLKEILDIYFQKNF